MEIDFIGELTGLAVHRAFQDHGGTALARVTARQRQLVAAEQIGQRRRINFVTCTSPVNFIVGFASTGSLIFEKKLETFTSMSSSGKTYWLTAWVFLGDLVEQMGVHIAAHAEQKMRVRPSLSFFTLATIGLRPSRPPSARRR